MTRKETGELLASNDGATLQMIAHKRLQAQIKTVLEDYELNMTQWLIISRLSHSRAGERTTDLARFMHVEVPLVTMMSRPLRKRGLIDTAAQTPDKREKLLTLTAKSKQIIKAVEKRLQDQLAGLIEGVSARDIQSYFRVLQTMAGAAV